VSIRHVDVFVADASKRPDAPLERKKSGAE